MLNVGKRFWITAGAVAIVLIVAGSLGLGYQLGYLRGQIADQRRTSETVEHRLSATETKFASLASQPTAPPDLGNRLGAVEAKLAGLADTPQTTQGLDEKLKALDGLVAQAARQSQQESLGLRKESAELAAKMLALEQQAAKLADQQKELERQGTYGVAIWHIFSKESDILGNTALDAKKRLESRGDFRVDDSEFQGNLRDGVSALEPIPGTMLAVRLKPFATPLKTPVLGNWRASVTPPGSRPSAPTASAPTDKPAPPGPGDRPSAPTDPEPRYYRLRIRREAEQLTIRLYDMTKGRVYNATAPITPLAAEGGISVRPDAATPPSAEGRLDRLTLKPQGDKLEADWQISYPGSPGPDAKPQPPDALKLVFERD